MAVVQIKSDSRYPLNRDRVRAAVEKVLAEHGATSDLVISVAVVGNRKMRMLNREYHDIDAPTDVLSFPYLDPESSQDIGSFVEPESEQTILGDIVVSYPYAVAQAGQKQVLVDDEIDFLVEHGMLHLLGIHHD